MKYPTWVMWLALFVIVMMIFPKECERVPSSPVMEYKCMGINKMFSSKIKSTNQTIDWCSGVCISKSLKVINKNNETSKFSGSDPASGLISSFTKIIPPLALILVAIFFVTWINSMKKKGGGGGEIRVVAGPGQSV